ncbi:MAG TPA: DUF1638 domain-containing protein [Coriobacteriia bacterium]|nr:DUF1638 domain-containing protein [Coriobacteriia bacterium]
MRIAVIACDMIKHEIARLVENDPDISEVVYLEAALHIYPEKMRDAIIDQVNALAGEVDAVFLGYGYCQSLKGIEDLVDVPVVLPPYDDCIMFLLTPERYREEIAKEVGTWFMSPGWADVSAHMVIKELRLDRALKYGRDPMEMAKRLFTHYKRGLFFNTGMAENDLAAHRVSARQFCTDFGLEFEETAVPESPILREELERCKRLAR